MRFSRQCLAILTVVAFFLFCQTTWGIERRRPQAPKLDYVKGEILVMFQTGVPRERIDDINNMLGTSVLKQTGRLYVIRVPRTMSVEGMVDKYNAMPGVEYAEPNYIFTTQE
jgi:hypothetical protein